MRHSIITMAAAALFVAVATARADVSVTVDHNDVEASKPSFTFKRVPPPSKTDAASKAKFAIVDGERDEAGGDLEKLNDGKLPTEQDEPHENFFFDAGTDGGRIGVDLGRAIEIKQINTYSWHPDTRGPQVYKVYAADGSEPGFNSSPKAGYDPTKSGFKRIAAVDTRPKPGEPAGGGQYGVSIADSAGGAIGKYRYLLFEASSTEDADDYGNTFFSEIDVIDAAAPTTSSSATTQPIFITGKYATIEVTNAPELQEWAQSKLLPVCDEWYPIIVKMLPSEGYTAPEHFTIQFRNNMNRGIPAATGAGQISCNIAWFKRNLEGEARGAIVHEMVHVVQQYGLARRNNPQATRNPGWMVEGVADYIRWFKYEPQTHGAEIRNAANAKFDASYRVTANFLNWVTDKYDKDLVAKMNAAMRQGKYSDELWKQYTGKTAEELAAEWKESLPGGGGAAAATTAPSPRS